MYLFFFCSFWLLDAVDMWPRDTGARVMKDFRNDPGPLMPTEDEREGKVTCNASP